MARWARVTWWLGVAGAGGAYRLSLHRLGLRPDRLVRLATVAPFLLFALGIAIGSEWTAWH